MGSEINKSLVFRVHPTLNKNNLYEEIERPLDKLKTEIKRFSEGHPDFLQEDPILDEILNLFDGRVGTEYDNQRLQEIYQQGQDRYSKKIPPGYKDAEGTHKKEGDDIYGDLIIWCQMIDKAKEIKKPIMFITNDVKEDWLWSSKGKRLGCHPKLREEMQRESDQAFYIYTGERFLEYTSKRLNVGIKEDTIVEVQSIQEEEEQRYAEQRQQAIDSIRKNIAPFREQLERSIQTIIDQSVFDQYDQYIKQQEERKRLAREIVNLFPFLGRPP